MARHSPFPQNIDKRTWYFESRYGLNVTHEIRGSRGKYIQTDQFFIPWRMIEASMKRHKAKSVVKKARGET